MISSGGSGAGAGGAGGAAARTGGGVGGATGAGGARLTCCACARRCPSVCTAPPGPSAGGRSERFVVETSARDRRGFASRAAGGGSCAGTGSGSMTIGVASSANMLGAAAAGLAMAGGGGSGTLRHDGRPGRRTARRRRLRGGRFRHRRLAHRDPALAEQPLREDVVRRGGDHGLQLGARGGQIAALHEDAAQRQPQGRIRVALQPLAADADRLPVLPFLPEVLRHLRVTARVGFRLQLRRISSMRASGSSAAGAGSAFGLAASAAAGRAALPDGKGRRKEGGDLGYPSRLRPVRQAVAPDQRRPLETAVQDEVGDLVHRHRAEPVFVLDVEPARRVIDHCSPFANGRRPGGPSLGIAERLTRVGVAGQSAGQSR